MKRGEEKKLTFCTEDLPTNYFSKPLKYNDFEHRKIHIPHVSSNVSSEFSNGIL